MAPAPERRSQSTDGNEAPVAGDASAGRVAVLLGGQANALSVARSLGRAGIEVVALGSAEWAPIRYSRFCTRFVDLPTPDGRHNAWLEWLEQGPRGAVVLPCADLAVELIVQHRRRLEELGYAVYEMNDAIALAMLDKQRTYELAREVGVAAPRTLPLRGARDAGAVAAAVGFPCGIKPLYPNEWRRRFSNDVKLFIVRDAEELEAALELTDGLDVLATEIIPGEDDALWAYYAYIDADGTPLCEFVRQKLRQHPPGFGGGTYAVSRWEEDVAAAGRRYFTGIGLRGFAYAEFKRDASDGRLVLIEVNHRFGNLHELLEASGVEAALLTYRRLSGGPLPRAGAYREGVRLLFLVEDVRSFLISRRRAELTFASWARSLLHPTRFPVLQMSDPLPSLMTCALMLRRLGRRLRRGKGGEAAGGPPPA